VGRRILLVALLLSGAGCVKKTGTGDVTGFFSVVGCTMKSDRPASSYGFDAGGLGTNRFNDNLEISIQQYPVRLEETDGLLIRLPSVMALRANSMRPLVVPVSTAPSDVNAALSLFQTCPDRPQLYAVEGTISFDLFTIQADPANTGDNEVLKATLTATVVSVEPGVRVGWVRSSFDFFPQALHVSGPQQ
jgi:hypothetical protein